MKWTEGVQNVEAVAENLQDSRWSGKQLEGLDYALGEAVYRLLSLGYITEYRDFATARYRPEGNPRVALSWEGIHK